MSKTKAKSKKAKTPAKKTITVDYVSVHTLSYHSTPATGVYVTPTPLGDLSLDFFYEKFPLPTSITHKFTPPTVGKELSRKIQLNAIVREINTGIVMSIDTAESLISILIEKITQIKQDTKKIK